VDRKLEEAARRLRAHSCVRAVALVGRGRVQDPEPEVDAYLLSDEADNVTGTTLYVDSGYHAMSM
jgi:enoyl-[acyl-carrier-protein] reductase (NADH)